MRYTIRMVESKDRDACLELFEKSFGEAVDPLFWDWKYSMGRNVSFVAFREGKLVAHYGCLSRKINAFGMPGSAVQITDVMVDPTERGLFTKRGAFYLVASASQVSLIGSGSSDHLLGYGFPTERHMRLGMRSGLYEQVERMTELYWEPHMMVNSMMTVAMEIRLDEHIQSIRTLWSKMKQDLCNCIIGEREADYLILRYQVNPKFNYHFFLVSRRWGQPLGLIVLRRDGELCRLIDAVAPIRNLPLLVGYARSIAAEWGSKTMVAWITSHQAISFGNNYAERVVSNICIPCNVYHHCISSDRVRNKWWMMMGDTDFM